VKIFDRATVPKTIPTVAEVGIEQIRTCWWNLFSELLYNLTDYELSSEECKRKVGLAAELTDAAIKEYEKRWGVRGK
jgi:hypothetical protein